MNSVQFIDAVRARHGLTSDNKLAAFLGVDRGRVALYRTGRRKLDPEACLAVAKALELPAEHVFASIAAERAKRTEHRRVWQRLAKAAKELPVVCVVGLVAATSTPPSAHAAGVDAGSLYILLTRLLRRLAELAPRGADRRGRRVSVAVDRRRSDRRRRRHFSTVTAAAA